MKVSELEGALLDYWVAKAEGLSARFCSDRSYVIVDKTPYCPSTSWTIGGPILERSLISVLYGPVDSIDVPGYWTGFIRPSDDIGFDASTPLVAGMRARVASWFGEEVPDSTD
ncbi:phage protein NinX family protein [Paraburkholderia fungorum]|uniref:phage protein NinX family protein n=1 Tax=Paraburkholderia fungorum TaxID=134537 RepID=UPI0038780FB0